MEPNPEPNPEVEKACFAFLQAQDSGSAPDPEEWLAGHPPALRPALREFLEMLGVVTPGRRRRRRRTVADRLPDTARYTGLELIGAGGMGAVYRAIDTVLGRAVALKVLHPDLAVDPRKVERFRAEARTAGQLQHSNLTPVHDYDVMPGDPPRPFFAMQLVAPRTMADAIAEYHRGPTDAGRDALLRQFIAVCGAVAYAHGAGVLHRDLKPANVMVGTFGEVRVMDWGLSTALAGELVDLRDGVLVSAAEPGESAAGVVRGTLAYMPPEQARGERLDRTADVFALGGLLCHIFTNRPVYEATTASEQLRAAMDGATGPALIRLAAAEPPPNLLALVRECLAADSTARPTSAAAVGDRVAEYLASAERRARAAEVARVVAARRRRWLAAAATAAVVAFVSIGYATVEAVNRRAANTLRAQAETDRDAATGARAVAEAARDGERVARTAAEGAQVGEQKARADAESARDQLAREREKLARIEYGRTIQVAYQEARAGNLRSARALLDGTRPDLRGWEWGYVHRLCHLEVASLVGHRGGVTGVAFSPDGTKVATAGDDGTARVWDATTGRPLTALKHPGPVTAVVFSPDGTKVATAGDDRAARLWDAARGEVLKQFVGHRGGVTGVAFSPDGTKVATAGDDGTARVWDARSAAQLASFGGHRGGVAAVAFSPDGSTVVTAGDDGTARLWGATTAAEGHVLKGHGGEVTAAAFDRTGAAVVTAGADGTTRLWDAKTGRPTGVLRGHTGRVRAAVFAPDGTKVATAGDDKTVRVWDVKTGVGLAAPVGEDSPVMCVALSPDGGRLAAGALNGTAGVWGAAAVTDADASPGPRELTVRGEFGAWYSGDGSRLAVAEWAGTVRVLDAVTGRRVATLEGGLLVALVAFGPDGSRLVTGEPAGFDAGRIRVWDAATGKPLRARDLSGLLRAVCVSPDGSLIATGHEDGAVRVWDAATLELRAALTGHTAAVWSVAFSPDGTAVLSGGDDATARLWDLHTRTEVRRLNGHTAAVRAVAFDLDGRRAVTGSNDWTARVWDVATGTERIVLRGHTAAVDAAEFDRAGGRIVTGSGNGQVRVWDAETGAELLTLAAHTHLVKTVGFSPDGTRIVTAGGTVRVWDSTPVSGRFLSDRLAPPPRRVWRAGN